MAEKLTFTSVELDKLGRDKKGVWATFSASFTSEVIQALGWAEIPECYTGGALEGEITAISLELIPNDKPLARHRTQLDLAQVKGFETVRRELEGKQGKGHRTELRFDVYCQDQEGAAKLERYKLTCGKSKMLVSYEKPATQTDLPGVEADTGCVACNNGIEHEEGDPKNHVTGQKCTRRPVQEAMTQ